MSSERRRTLLWVLVGGGAFFLFVLAVFTLVYLAVRDDDQTGGTRFAFGNRIGVIEVKGVILESEPTVRHLRRFADDGSIKAIILRINSPGGGAAASQEIYETVKRIREEGRKPIVASIETVGASGGYYIAIGSEKVYANPAAIVGSIGVIAQWFNYGELVRWAKMQEITLKSGELKDAGSPFRDLTPREREYLQGLIDDMHGQFMAAVAEGREMSDEELAPLANGRVWTGQQAMPLGLIDELADFHTVVRQTADQVGIRGEPNLVRPGRERRTLLDFLVDGDINELIPTRAKLLESQVGFYYLWR